MNIVFIVRFADADTRLTHITDETARDTPFEVPSWMIIKFHFYNEPHTALASAESSATGRD